MILRVLILAKMKILLVLLLFLFFNLNGYLMAQHTFEKVISEPEDQIINNIIEDNIKHLTICLSLHYYLS